MPRAAPLLAAAAAVAAAAIAVGAAPGAAMAACVEHHAQLAYDGGTSARTLPDYTVWQSFTPDVSGTLCRIDMGFFNDMSGRGRLDILEGEGTGGSVLQSLTVPVVGITRPGVTWNEWDVSVPVVAGSTYTWNLTPDAATLPDPYGVCVGSGNPYAAGTMGIDDPSGSYPMTFDVVFRVHLDGSAPGWDVFRSDVAAGLRDAAHVIGTATLPPHDDAAPPPDDLLFYAIEDDPGAPAMILLERLPGDGVRIRW